MGQFFGVLRHNFRLPPSGVILQGADRNPVLTPAFMEDHAVQFDMPAHRIIGPAGEIPSPMTSSSARMACSMKATAKGSVARQGAFKREPQTSSDIFSAPTLA